MKATLTLIGVTICALACLLTVLRFTAKREQEESKPYITYTRLMYVASCCDKYREQFGSWPASLTQLVTFRPELKDWAKDAWGRGSDVWGEDVVLIPYNETVGYGEIVSYGRDGKVGGVAFDQDMIVRFPVAGNSNWNEHLRQSLKEPSRRQ